MKKKPYETPNEWVRELLIGRHFCLSATGTNESFEEDSYEDTWKD